jgi:hypothetical protein
MAETLEAGFSAAKINASPCNFQFRLPSFTFGLNLPTIPFPPFVIPFPRFRLEISCDLSKPLDVSAGLSYGGGRASNNDPSPDDDDSF